MTKFHEVLCDGNARAAIVTANELYMRRGFIGRNQHRRQVRVDRFTNEGAVATLRLRKDEAVYLVVAHPLEHDRRIVLASQFRTGKHQTAVVLREFLLDA